MKYLVLILISSYLAIIEMFLEEIPDDVPKGLEEAEDWIKDPARRRTIVSIIKSKCANNASLHSGIVFLSPVYVTFIYI